jgi:hypothetical protein
MTKQEVMAVIKDCAHNLGRAPNALEFTRHSGVKMHVIRTLFGRFNRALRQCRLKPSRESHRVKMPELLRDWAGVVRTLERLPTVMEYRKLGRHSETPLCHRFRSWHQVARCFKDYAQKHGWTKEWQDVLRIITAHDKAVRRAQPFPKKKRRKPRLLPGRPVYGSVMHASPMAHGPINESGVIFLFGVWAERLGFVVLRIQNAFPDCEAMRRIDRHKWQLVRIEFEHESRNFLKHRHKTSKCDLIVCWKHNWPECPLEVLELSRAV